AAVHLGLRQGRAREQAEGEGGYRETLHWGLPIASSGGTPAARWSQIRSHYPQSFRSGAKKCAVNAIRRNAVRATMVPAGNAYRPADYVPLDLFPFLPTG